MDSSSDQSLRGLRWDSAQVRQVAASGESMYDDAFTIQCVERVHVIELNYVSGMVPFLLALIYDRKQGLLLNAKKTHMVLTALEELRKFMMVKNQPNKNRQKLMRNLRVIDLLVKILQCPLDGVADEQNLILVFKEAYEILYTYMIGKSRKNALYFAKYIEFFQTQFTQKGGIGLNVAQMIVELIRDKRKIVDRITHSQIDEFVSLLETSQNYRFLDLLQVLCVCDDVAIPNNQSYIVERWMDHGRKGVFLTARGQDINRMPNILYVSTNNGHSWQALHEFLDESNPSYDKDHHDFLIHQLDLYKALCHGRNDYAINMITKELRYLTWEETFLSLRSDILPDAIRAKYCDLTIGLFVDVGNNYSVLDHPNICFVYDYVGSKDEEKSQGDFIVKELVAIFPVLRDWIAEFLEMNNCMVASEIGHNMLVEQVLRLLYHLVKFGYYMDSEDVQNLLPRLFNLLDGRRDLPFPKDKGKVSFSEVCKKTGSYTEVFEQRYSSTCFSKESMRQVIQFQTLERYDESRETEIVVNAKYQVLDILDLLLTYQRNSRLQIPRGSQKPVSKGKGDYKMSVWYIGSDSSFTGTVRCQSGTLAFIHPLQGLDYMMSVWYIDTDSSFTGTVRCQSGTFTGTVGCQSGTLAFIHPLQGLDYMMSVWYIDTDSSFTGTVRCQSGTFTGTVGCQSGTLAFIHPLQGLDYKMSVWYIGSDSSFTGTVRCQSGTLAFIHPLQGLDYMMSVWYIDTDSSFTGTVRCQSGTLALIHPLWGTSFVGKFKVAEQSAGQRKQLTVTVPLLYDTFDPHDQSKKALSLQGKVNKELINMFNLSAIFDIELLTKILMDLTNYKYNKIITKSLNILNKIYSSKRNAFRLASKAQILLTQDSARVHREVLKNMPILRRLARAKLDDQQVKLMGNILDDLAEFCHLPMTPDEPHPMNQNIMVSNGILTVLFDVLVQEIDTKLLGQQYSGMTDIFKKAFYLLKLLARENGRVQHHIFERLDILLDVHVVQSDLAIALKEVFCGNQATCLKISPRQIQKIVNRAAEQQEKAPEFLDLLGMIVKVVGTGLTLKRNQAYVMKYIMQNYRKVAFVLDLQREEREKILTNPNRISTLRYYISLLDLLAACAEGENMFIESLCQTILPLDDLLWVLNNDKVENVYKKPFLKCLHHVYLKSGDTVMETGASEMSHFGDLWEFLSNVSVDMNRLTDSVKEDPDKIGTHLKTAPEKSSQASAPDFESSAYGSVLFFLDGVLPFLEAFYRDFYYPDPQSHGTETDETDHLAKAVVLFGEVVGPLLYKPHHMKNLVNCLTTIVPISNMPNSNLEHVLDRFASGITVEDTSSAVRRGNIEYYADEVEINAKFRTFTKNSSTVFYGHNTVTAQLKISSKREYTEIGGDEELPMGEEFQSHIKCFLNSSEKKPDKRVEWTEKLITQLHISMEVKRMTESARLEMDELNIKCLQILRGIIHNEERKLPEDWATRTTEPKIEKYDSLIEQLSYIIVLAT
ncbi:hypothetical protein CHS0354_029791 [Potamilus streckersoni]|uniref:RIH domain-containing protein n=1 Tax=Potamilus streckersoni TaxID=2493646 RepID=A0AAE0WE69_9BIVA|nr:hypothetical protein CHS0354_029791 [Potamilus streckersoni]